MSNRPSRPEKSQANPSEGWHQPDAPGGWRAPAESAEPVTGWRVPTLPTSMDVVPDQEGDWHLPQPEDTTFTSDDVSEVIGVVERPPDAIDPIDALAEAVSGAGQPAPAPPARASRSPEDLMSMALERTAPEDEDDDDAFSVSELVALASLVEEQPKAAVTPAASAPAVAPVMPTPAVEEETAMDLSALSPAERALFKTEAMPAAPALESETLDAAEYARQQLAKLEEGEPATLGSLLEKSQPAALDPAEYARRQLEALGAEPGDRTPLPQQTAPLETMDPALVELANKFRDTELRVRALRAQYMAGRITRDDLQTQLKQLMILDNNQVWWMMGVETDTWYKFENNEWVAATPPVGPKKGAPPTMTGTLEPGQVLQGSLPYLPADQGQYGQTGPTEYDPNQYQYGSTGVRVGGDYMPLPQQVPVRDPEHTVVGRGGVYLDPYRSSEAPTLEGTQRISEPTVLAQPVQYGQEAVEGPYAAEPPDYSLEEEAPTYEEIARKQRQNTVRALVLIAVAGVALVLVIATGFVLFALSWYNGIVAQFEPQIAAIPSWEPPFQTARILDARGDLIVELNSQEGGARKPVELKDVAPELIHAVISVENERFYEDPGWDIIAISRAFLQNLSAGGIESGASTITQQIARAQVLGSTETTAERKINEIVIAGEIAKRYKKDQILKIYLDSVFFGNQSYGIEAAAEFYFGKTAADLNLAESALLAGLIASPAQYDPVINRQAAFDRMTRLLYSTDASIYQNIPVGVVKPRDADEVVAAVEIAGRTLGLAPDAIRYVIQYNLDSDDALHLAAAGAQGVTDLASFDEGLRRVDVIYLWNDFIHTSY